MFLTINNRFKPFLTDKLNEMENLSLVTSLLSVYCGLYYISAVDSDEVEPNSGDIVLSPLAEIVLFSVIVGSNIVFFISLISNILYEAKETLRKKDSRFYFIYKIVFLRCGRKKEVLQYKYIDENKHLVKTQLRAFEHRIQEIE